MIRALIIDDEESAVNVVKLLLQKHVTEVTEIHSAIGPLNGMKAIETFKPDLLFLDIEMPMMSGFDLLEKFPENSLEVIFITAYDHYAIKAIKFSALDYLLKPIDADELKNAVQRFIERRNLNGDQHARYNNLLHNLKSETPKDYRLSIATTEGTYFYTTDDIIRCEADSNYTKFFLRNQKPIITSRTLKEFDEILSGHGFIRVHRAHLVNRKYVKSFSNDHEVQLTDGTIVEVSRRKWDDVKGALMN